MENLLAVVVGGLIAIVGGAVSPIIQHRLGRQSKQSDERSAAIQDLIFATHEHKDWTDKRRENYVFGKDHDLSANPLPKIQAACALHFPELTPNIQQLELADTQERLWCIARSQERLEGEAIDLSDWGPVYQNYLVAIENIAAAVSGRRVMKVEEIWPVPVEAENGV